MQWMKVRCAGHDGGEKGGRGREEKMKTKKGCIFEPAQLFYEKPLIYFAKDTVPRWLFSLFFFAF